MGLLDGKKALVLGLANHRSIAWGIVQALKKEGAQIGLSYLNDALLKRVEPLAEEIGADFIFEMDVTKDEHYDKMVKLVSEKWGKFDILVHSLAFANREDLQGEFSDTSREGFKLAMDISAFSLVGLCGKLKNLMNDKASVIAMTYHGSTQVIRNYKVMGVAKAALEACAKYLAADLGDRGIRVNCISAGPIKTLAASGVPGFGQILKEVQEKAPLKRNVTPEDIGKTAIYLLSDLSDGVTGQILYVDAGFSIVAK